MVGQGVHALLAQGFGDFLDPFARLAIDDAGVAGVFGADETQQLCRGILLLDDGVANVGTVETADECARVLQLQPLNNVLARQRVGGGGERNPRHTRETLVQHCQGAVFGPEVVTPLAHAVHLVDGKQAEFAAFAHRVELGQETRCRHAFGRGVQQRQFAAQHALLDLCRFLAGQGGIEKGRADTGFVQCADLVVHQRDQRRDHHRRAAPGALARNRRYLVTQRLAAARGHQHQRVAAGNDVVDHALLWPAKLRVAENVVQYLARVGRGTLQGQWCGVQQNSSSMQRLSGQFTVASGEKDRVSTIHGP